MGELRSGRRRLAGLAAVSVVALACDDGGSSSGQKESRVVAVEAEESKPDLDAFCDLRAHGADAKPFEWPSDLEGKPPTLADDRWRWLNVWATWCQPCVDEIPRLVEWEDRLAKNDAPVQLVFLSVDGSADDVAEYRKEHPEVPETLRLGDRDALKKWITGLGMDPGATIPLQIFFDPEGQVRCMRSGAVDPEDYATVRALVSGSE